MVSTLTPGVSTLTQFARYYTLYWAIADLAGREELDRAACLRLVRRCEVLLAHITLETHGRDVIVAHGADAIARGRSAGRSLWEVAATGEGSYSPRIWGFWSQYGGPSDVLGTATTEDGALRPGRHRCPDDVRGWFAPLLAAARREAEPERVDALGPLSLGSAGPDLDALRDLVTATRAGRHEPDDWRMTDATRRSTLRILMRAADLYAGLAPVDAARWAVAFGPTASDDLVLAAEDRTPAWRGLLLRHYSVGAWRALWAELVAHVKDLRTATLADLHTWITDKLPDQRLAAWLDDLPSVLAADGHPAPAEETLLADDAGPARHLALLALGAQRRDTLNGAAQIAFRGGRNLRASFLDPEWVGRRVAHHRDRHVGELG